MKKNPVVQVFFEAENKKNKTCDECRTFYYHQRGRNRRLCESAESLTSCVVTGVVYY